MPTENRRVAAYLPKSIDERLETFKTERGLKGDSPALIAILEEYFGVSREVAYSSNTPIDIEAIKSELFSELKDELLGSISVLKGELLSELQSELRKVDHVEQLSIPTPEVDQQVEIPSDSSIEPASESPSQVDEPGEEKDSEPSSEQNGKPLDGSVAWSGVELSTRLKRGASTLSAVKEPEELAKWTQEKDPDGIAWMRVGRGQYFPITDAHQGF